MAEPEVVLHIGSSDDNQRRFRGQLMPGHYIAVGGVAFELVKTIAAGRVVVTPPPGSSADETEVPITEMRVFPASDGKTVIVILKAGVELADVSIPSSVGDRFHALVDEHKDVITALKGIGVSSVLRPQPWKNTGDDAGSSFLQPPAGWTPYFPPGGHGEDDFGICCVFSICNCDDNSG